MPHMQLENIEFGYPDKPILQKINWRIDATMKIGLVGRNGVGKSTLLKIMTGELQPESGAIYNSKDLKIGYLRQHYGRRTDITLREYIMEAFAELIALGAEVEALELQIESNASDEQALKKYGELRDAFEARGGYTYSARIDTITKGLGFNKNDFDRSLESFSGGEANRAAIVKILLADPNLIILDEPTNHLDIQAIEWLEEYLKDFQGGFVVVTHDRYFLDRTVNQIVELEHGELSTYHGNYSAYVVEKEERIQKSQKLYRMQQEFIERTEDFIRRNIAGQKTKQAKSRMKMLDRLEVLDKPQQDNRSMGMRFDTDHYGGYVMLQLRNIGKRFGDQTILDSVDSKLIRGDKIGLIGPNGSGKSTLLHIIRGALLPTNGEVEVGYKVQIGYYDQHLREVDPQKTVLEDFTDRYPTMTQFEARSFLGRFLFTGEEVFKPVGVLSGGETSRLALAKLMYTRPNLLLLDEPTNHLDMPGREVLEQALIEFPGTIVLVSHDRYLLDRVATKIWRIERTHLSEYLGNYSAYREQRVKEEQYNKPLDSEDDKFGDKKLSKKDIRRKRADERARFGPPAAAIEKQIADLEQQLQEIKAQLYDGRHGSNWELLVELQQKQKALEQEIEPLIEQWEQAVEREENELR